MPQAVGFGIAVWLGYIFAVFVLGAVVATVLAVPVCLFLLWLFGRYLIRSVQAASPLARFHGAAAVVLSAAVSVAMLVTPAVQHYAATLFDRLNQGTGYQLGLPLAYGPILLIVLSIWAIRPTKVNRANLPDWAAAKLTTAELKAGGYLEDAGPKIVLVYGLVVATAAWTLLMQAAHYGGGATF